MPAPRPERRDNPLLKLRTLLGNDKRMLQTEFATLTGIPISTIRAIEAGSRQLNWENSLRSIYHSIGVEWDSNGQAWVMADRFGSD